MHTRHKGILLAVISNILFSLLYFYGVWMSPLHGVDIFAWRMVCSFPAVCFLLTVTATWRDVREFIRRYGFNLRRWLVFFMPTPILAGQLLLFMWAPLNGKGMDVAIGYFLFPLGLALGGVLLFRERLNRAQKLAITLAAAGVLLEIFRTGTFSWATVAVFVTYPIYYLIRRYQNIPSLIGIFFDFLLIFPFALGYLLFFSDSIAIAQERPLIFFWAVVLGIHSAIAFQSNLSANNYLPVILFSILSYLEPILLFVIAVLFLGEALSFATLASYSLIWMGICIVIVHNWRELRQQHD